VSQTGTVNGTGPFPAPPRWQVVLPVKGGPSAKTRLRRDLDRTATAAAWAGTEVLAAAQALLTGPGAPPMVALGDADGQGTVMVAARRPVDVAAAFGPDSLHLHRRRGALTLDGAFERLRRDVDTVADLHHAAALGLGRHTAAVLAGTGSWLTGEDDELPASQAC